MNDTNVLFLTDENTNFIEINLTSDDDDENETVMY